MSFRQAIAGVVALALASAAAGCGGSGDKGSGKASQSAKSSTAAPVTGPSTWPKPLLTGQAAKTKSVPILMYHVVSEAKAGVAYPDLWVSKENFAAEIAALKNAGFTGITLGQLWAAWHGNAELPAKPIVVSFDDGYLSHATHAGPVLKAAHWPGVLNLEIKNIGPKGIPAPLVKRLIANGWEIDSHTINHPDMTTLTPAAMRAELTGSRDAIVKQFGVRPWFFCYPAGKYNATVEQQLRATGYLGAQTEIPGWAKPTDNPFELPRVRVNGSDSAQSLLAKVQSGAN